MKLIAFGGKLGSGKTTAAKLLVDRYGYERLSFAAPLYDMLEAGGFGRPSTLEEKMAVSPVLKGLGLPDEKATWRYAAQTLGTEWGRHCFTPDIWTKLALARCRADRSYVIDDCRFENESAMVRACGGRVIHVIGRRGDAGEAGNHASEAGLVLYPNEDLLLDNSGTLIQLEDRLLELLRGIDG